MCLCCVSFFIPTVDWYHTVFSLVVLLAVSRIGVTYQILDCNCLCVLFKCNDQLQFCGGLLLAFLYLSDRLVVVAS